MQGDNKLFLLILFASVLTAVKNMLKAAAFSPHPGSESVCWRVKNPTAQSVLDKSRRWERCSALSRTARIYFTVPWN